MNHIYADQFLDEDVDPLIRPTLHRLGIQTWSHLRDLDLDEISDFRGIGAKKRRLLEELLIQARAQRLSASMMEPPQTVASGRCDGQCAQRLSASLMEPLASSVRWPSIIRASAQRLSASLMEPRNERCGKISKSIVLNAFRHH